MKQPNTIKTNNNLTTNNNNNTITSSTTTSTPSRLTSTPPKSQWFTCCVPIDELLRRYEISLNKRFLMRSMCFHFVYLSVIIAVAAQFAQPLSIYLSNTGFLLPLTLDNQVRVPQAQMILDSTTRKLTPSPWRGPLLSGYEAVTFRDWQVMEMTRVARESIEIINNPLAIETFLYPTTIDQKRAQYFVSCGNSDTMKQYNFTTQMGWNSTAGMQCSVPVMFAPCADGPSFVDSCIPDKVPMFAGVPVSCALTSTDHAVVNSSANVCDRIRGGSPIQVNCFYVPNDPWFREVSSPTKLGGSSGGGGSNPQWFSQVVTYGPFQDLSKVWVDNRTRITYSSDALLNPGTGIIKSQTVALEQDMSGAVTTTYIATSSHYYDFSSSSQGRNNDQVALYIYVALIFVDLLSFGLRLWFRPRSLLSLWLVFDIIQIVFYIIFLVLISTFFNEQSTYPLPPISTTDGSPDTCSPQNEIIQFRQTMQIFGVLFALTFLTMFKLTTFLNITALAWNTLVMSFRTLSWALLLIAVAYLICGYASTLMFGPNAVWFSSIAYGFSAIGLMGFEMDVSILYAAMRESQPLLSAAPTAFFVVVVFSLQLITSSVVSSIVAVTYLRVKAIHASEDRFDTNSGDVITNDQQQRKGSGGATATPTITGSGGGKNEHSNKTTGATATTTIATNNTTMPNNNNTTTTTTTTTTSTNNPDVLFSGDDTNSNSWMKSCSRSCSMTFHWINRLLKQTVTGRYEYESVPPFVVLDRLVTWYNIKENRDKTFITFDEISEAISLLDTITKLAYVNPYQVVQIMETCGAMNVYSIDHARFLEREWAESIAKEKTHLHWTKRSAEDIARYCKRIVITDSMETELSTGRYVSERESALNRSLQEALQKYDKAEVSNDNLFAKIREEVNKVSSEISQFLNELQDIVIKREEESNMVAIAQV
jgi:hypothetical protein